MQGEIVGMTLTIYVRNRSGQIFMEKEKYLNEENQMTCHRLIFGVPVYQNTFELSTLAYNKTRIAKVNRINQHIYCTNLCVIIK